MQIKVQLPLFGNRNQAPAFGLPKIGIFCRYAIRASVEEHLVLFRLPKEKHIPECAVSYAADSDTQGTLEQIGIFALHHVTAWVITKVPLPILHLTVAHKDMVIIIRFEE